MAKAKLANLRMLQFAADKLGELASDLVFIGGSITALLITDDAVPDVRATIDVDCIIDVLSLTQYHALEQALTEKGFKRSLNESVICRWFYDDIILDIMPTDKRILGFGNVWYKAAATTAVKIKLEDDASINVITAPYFLATKCEAFADRGQHDYLASHDFEDIISVIDGRPEIVDEVSAADVELKAYLADKFARLLADEHFHDALPGHLTYYGTESEQRAAIIIERIKTMISD